MEGIAHYFDVPARVHNKPLAPMVYENPTAGFALSPAMQPFMAALMDEVWAANLPRQPAAGNFYGGDKSPNLDGRDSRARRNAAL